MTIKSYTFSVRECSTKPVEFQAEPDAAKQILEALGCYWHGDEGFIAVDGFKAWSGQFLIGNTDLSKFIEQLT